jgi:hypothetical protein
MKKKDKSTDCCCQENVIVKNHQCCGHGQSNAIYGLSVVGALFYFLQGATTFGLIVMGIVKAVFWPAILMFELLSYLGL